MEDLGAIELKGKSERVGALRILGRRRSAGRRRGLDAMGISSPMVGRDEHLETLVALLDVVRAGRGRVAFVIGEPGIGKSRLLAELKRRSVDEIPADATAAWIEGHCVSYGRSLPYHLLLVGSPEEIPFDVQYQLDVQHSVGRLYFDSVDDYRRYAASVLAVEAASPVPAGSQRMCAFAPRNAGDPATNFATTIKNAVTVTVSYQWFPEAFMVGPITLKSSTTLPLTY